MRPGKHSELTFKGHIGLSPSHQTTYGRAIVGQRQGRQCSFANNHRMHKLDRNVLCIGRPGSIPKSQEPTSLVEAPRHSPASLSDLCRFTVEERLRYGHALLEACCN